MAKGKSTWKYNKLLTARRNYFWPGGSLLGNTGINIPGMPSLNPLDGINSLKNIGSTQAIHNTVDLRGPAGNAVRNASTPKTGGSFLGLDWSNPFKGADGAAAKGALVSAAGSAIGGIGGGLLSGGMTSTLGNVLSGLSGIAGAIPGPWGAVAGAGLGLVGGLANRMFGSKMNTENIAKVEANINNLNNFQSNASDFDTLSNNWANADVGMVFNDSYIGKDGWFSSKAKDKAADLRRQIEAGNAWVQSSLNNNAENIGTTQMQNLLSNYAAFGGELNTQGGDFTNGLLYIDNGGSHESNPYEGVPLGVDPEGVPNLVEEGETVFNDYVFSKRLKVPKAIKEKYKLRSTKDMTFAEMSKQMAKESEERPNDPISMRGLEALMSDLASAQESVRETQQVRQHAMGGRLFKGGGPKGNQTLSSNNRTKGLYFGLDRSQFNPYASDGTIDWDIMYGADSPYTKRRQYVIDHWDEPSVQDWLGRYVEGINKYNKDRAGYQPMSKSDITKDIFSNRTWDKSWGGMHAGIDYAGDPEKKIIEQHMLRNLEGDPTAMPETDIYYPNTRGGYTWADRFSDRYTRANNGAYEETTDDGNIVRTYYYDPIEKKKSGNRYYKKNSSGQYELVTGENPYLDIQNAGTYNQVRSVANDQDGIDYYYDPEETDPEYRKLPTGLRYTPAVGLGIAALTDAFGLTNKPDYGNAEAILEASRGAGTYQPVKFKPIGNYLTYRPFDRDYYINKMNAEAGATRRNIMNTSGGNRATAMAGLLAADNNVLNQIGGLARQAEEYNLAQRQQVEDFNRGTNTTNSQGFLQADIANQKALMDSRGLSLKGTMAATEMRERARLASEQAKSANLSGFVTALGDIGRENMAWNWRNFGLSTGSFGNVGDEEYLLTHTGKKRGNKGSKGGKIKRRKGLTI